MTTEQHPGLATERTGSAERPVRWLARAVLKRLFSTLRKGRLTVVTPRGVMVSSTPSGPGPNATLVIHRWRTLRRLIAGGDVAFALAYLDGDWSSPDLAALIELAAANDEPLRRAVSGFGPARALNRLLHRLRPNTKRGSRRNIMAHYDLGNAFYETWLDGGMSYSSALYRRGDEGLDEAQAAKQDLVIEALGITGGETVLEIGCGWGGLAERLGRLGCRVTGITLSPAQLAYGQDRIRRAGLSGLVELRLQDYRDASGAFDRIVSIEMIEAVGQAFWPAYFGAVRDRLRTGGHAVIQAITITDERFPFYASSPDVIQRLVFPGGMLLSPSILADQSAEAGLRSETVALFGPSYARTLNEWGRRFASAWPQIAGPNFDERFRRLWHYYLAYCEGGFRAGATDVGLYRLTPVR